MMTRLLAAAAATLFAAPALAQPVPDATRTEGEVLFTGFRAEALVGYSHQDVDVFSGDEADRLGVDRNYGSDGVQVGAGVGYDFDVGGLVLGIEGGVDWTLGDSRLEYADVQIDSKIDYGRDVWVGGRLGFRLGSNFLVYGKGGYTNLKVDTRGTAIIDDGNPETDDAINYGGEGKLDGWRAGAGIEMALPVGIFGRSAYAKAEYRHSDYSENVKKDEAMLGIGFRF